MKNLVVVMSNPTPAPSLSPIESDVNGWSGMAAIHVLTTTVTHAEADKALADLADFQSVDSEVPDKVDADSQSDPSTSYEDIS